MSITGPNTERCSVNAELSTMSVEVSVLPFERRVFAPRPHQKQRVGCDSSDHSVQVYIGRRGCGRSALLEPSLDEGCKSVTSLYTLRSEQVKDRKWDQLLLCSHIFAVPPHHVLLALKTGLKRMSSMQVNTIFKQVLLTHLGCLFCFHPSRSAHQMAI